jgi:DNA-binding MarR family transcriptional regulator
MDEKIRDILSVLEKFDDIVYSSIQNVGKRLSMKDPLGELTSTQCQAILKISNINPCTLSQAAKALRITKSSASALVERLVAKGVLEREQDPNNRRCVLINVAPPAQKFIKAVDDRLITEIKKIAKKIGADNFTKWHEAFHAINIAFENGNETGKYRNK